MGNIETTEEEQEYRRQLEFENSKNLNDFDSGQEILQQRNQEPDGHQVPDTNGYHQYGNSNMNQPTEYRSQLPDTMRDTEHQYSHHHNHQYHNTHNESQPFIDSSKDYGSYNVTQESRKNFPSETDESEFEVNNSNLVRMGNRLTRSSEQMSNSLNDFEDTEKNTKQEVVELIQEFDKMLSEPDGMPATNRVLSRGKSLCDFSLNPDQKSELWKVSKSASGNLTTSQANLFESTLNGSEDKRNTSVDMSQAGQRFPTGVANEKSLEYDDVEQQLIDAIEEENYRK